jgi:hypothetical protein
LQWMHSRNSRAKIKMVACSECTESLVLKIKMVACSVHTVNTQQDLSCWKYVWFSLLCFDNETPFFDDGIPFSDCIYLEGKVLVRYSPKLHYTVKG